MFRKSVFIIGLLMLVVAALTPDIASTVPAFARKYGLSCSTCHLAVPKLKDYGEEFAGNGFQLPDDDEPVRAFKDAGDDRLLLQRELPVAVRFDAFARYDTEAEADTDLEMPFGVKLLSGGAIAKDIGYYFYFYMNEKGEVAGLEDAYVHFNNIGGTEFDVLVGQFQVSDPLFKRELRLSFEDYQIYKTRVGDSTTDLTYDRGLYMTYSLPTNTDFVLEVVNGSGIGEADESFDNDSFKNVFAKVTQSYSIASLGMFAYSGKEKGEKGDNSFLFLGPDVSIGTDRFEINAQYVVRTDDNPTFTVGDTDEIETSGVIGEVTVNPFPDKSHLFATVLYNSVTSDMPGLEYETMTASLSYLYRTNLRLMVEFTQDMENEESQAVIGFVTGF